MTLYVEGWSPDYGSSVDADPDLAVAEGVVDTRVEGVDWAPIEGADDGIPVVAFIDGVRRVEARLVLDEGSGPPVSGICGAYAAGALLWHRDGRGAEIDGARVDRLAVFGGGKTSVVPVAAGQISYRSESVPDDDPRSLIAHLHQAMRKSEAELAEELAGRGYFVIADGPLYEYSQVEKVGYIKSHRRSYLDDEHGALIGDLEAGQRTPLFVIGEGNFRRYSWYLRLVSRAGGHSWHGIARCEASPALAMDRVMALADRTAALLPGTASLPQHDTRAPQNLVPIAGLERELKRMMGDGNLVLRWLREAVGREVA